MQPRRVERGAPATAEVPRRLAGSASAPTLKVQDVRAHDHTGSLNWDVHLRLSGPSSVRLGLEVAGSILIVECILPPM